MPSIGEVIQEVRVNRGWSQSELARRTGVTRATISLLESRKSQMPLADTLAKIADALEVSSDFILHESGLMKRSPYIAYLPPEVEGLAKVLDSYPERHRGLARRIVAQVTDLLQHVGSALADEHSMPR